MLFFAKSAIGKIIVTKIPFLGFCLLGSLPVLLIETANFPLAFWVFYYILQGWFWSWLLASWMSFSLVPTEQINVAIFSGVVGRTFLHQLKLYFGFLLSMLIVLVPVTFFLMKPLLGFATDDEMRSLQIAFSGRGEFTEPGLSFFLQTMFIISVIPVLIGIVFYLRCGFGMLALIEGSEKIGLIASWKKSKGTTFLALKSIIPSVFATALFVYLNSFAASSGVILRFLI